MLKVMKVPVKWANVASYFSAELVCLPLKKNCVLIRKLWLQLEMAKRAELMQSEARFYPKSPRSIHSLFLHLAQLFNQSVNPTVVESHMTPKKTQLMSMRVKKGGIWGAKHNQMADIPTHEKWQCFGACMNYWWGAHGALGSGFVFTKVNQPWVMSSTGTVAHFKTIKLPPHQLQTIYLLSGFFTRPWVCLILNIHREDRNTLFLCVFFSCSSFCWN